MLTDYIFIAHYPLLSEMNLEQMETFLEKVPCIEDHFHSKSLTQEGFQDPQTPWSCLLHRELISTWGP